MLRILSTLALLYALVLSIPITPAAASTTPRTQGTIRVIIQLAGSPLAADGNLKARTKNTLYRFRLDPTLATARAYSKALENYQQKELLYLAAKGIDLTSIRRFHILFNGFSARVPRSQLSRLQTLANIGYVRPERALHLLDNPSASLVHVPQAWAVLGGSASAGRGLYIADIDTGIDMTNPCFSDRNTPAGPRIRHADNAEDFKLTNNKVVVIRAFGSTPGKSYNGVDVVGHGTFTAAVEACDFNTPTPIGTPISGVAPAAYLMVYNVQPSPDAGISDSALIAAFESALQDSADVVNCSIGAPAGDERVDPLAQAVQLLSKAGLTVVASAANDGPTTETIGSPSSTAGAISVGASTNSRSVAENVNVVGPAPVPSALAQLRAVEETFPIAGSVGPAPLVSVGYGRVPGDDTYDKNANDFVGKDVHGKIALIERGAPNPNSAIHVQVKLENAQRAGAIAAIVFDNRFELRPPAFDVGTANLPAMTISLADGQALLDWLSAHPDATVALNTVKHTVDETPNILSDFSSRGFGPDYRIKPDLVAPGQDIYSAVESGKPGGELYDKTGFGSYDGTSFSAPHVTGAVALLLQRHPEWKSEIGLNLPAVVKAVIAETADAKALSVPDSPTPGVMEVGSGLLDINSALKASAYILPSSVSFGAVNVGNGTQQETYTLTLHDLGAGTGIWDATVQQLHTTAGLTVAIPPSVQLAGGKSADFPLHVGALSTTSPGNYDGYIFLRRGAESLHVPYFIHIASQQVSSGNVLLIDDTTSTFVSQPPKTPVKHLDVTAYYEHALQAIHQPFTYWNEAVNGTPSLSDMKRASAVILFTGANVNLFAPQNDNKEATQGPLNAVDISVLHSYLDQGGRVFLSGPGVALSDPFWILGVLGAQAGDALSVYDNPKNDAAGTGGISPPQPSAIPDNRAFVSKNAYLFKGMKGIDFSTKGDGAGDNVATQSVVASGLLGVPDLYPSVGSDSFLGHWAGRAVLRTPNVAIADGTGDVAEANSDEPTLAHLPKFAGRVMYFSFGFEGINDNTGFATRAQVLKRVFQWLDDRPKAAVSTRAYAADRRVTLGATLKTLTGVHAVSYQWTIGSSTLKATARTTTYSFTRRGVVRARVLITDSLGHNALSPWTNVTVR